MLKRLGESILRTVTFVIVFVLGVALAVATFIWHFIPKRERAWRAAENAEAAKRVAEIKAAVQTKVEAIEKKAEVDKATDSVEIANEIILKG